MDRQTKIAGFPAVVTKKRVKYLRLRVGADGTLRLSAPYGIGTAEIEAFVREKADWIEAARARAEKRSREARAFPSFENDFVRVFGERFPVEYRIGAQNRARFVGEGEARRVEISLKTDRDAEGAKAALRDFRTGELAARVRERFPYWENRMGLFATDVKIRPMTTRFGSCSPDRKTIRLALSLAEKPLECLDMVAVHELAHLRYRNHGAEFYDLVARYCPEHKRIRKILNGADGT